MTIAQFVKAPLERKSSLSRVFWLYGIVGSLLYGALGLFLNPENQLIMRLYTLGGSIYTLYVIVGTYRCADNCKTRWVARAARISAIISLLLLPVLTYLDLSGTLSIDSLLGGQLPE